MPAEIQYDDFGIRVEETDVLLPDLLESGYFCYLLSDEVMKSLLK